MHFFSLKIATKRNKQDQEKIALEVIVYFFKDVMILKILSYKVAH